VVPSARIIAAFAAKNADGVIFRDDQFAGGVKDDLFVVLEHNGVDILIIGLRLNRGRLLQPARHIVAGQRGADQNDIY
jgi:hypothetical protein